MLSAAQEAALDAQILAEEHCRKEVRHTAPPIVVRGKPVRITRYIGTLPWNEDCEMKLYCSPRLDEIRKAHKKRTASLK